jgi:RNA polymerase sigma-70 factor (ECF subfamily)
MGETKQDIFRVLKAQSGDKAALNELFISIQEPLYRYLLFITGEPANAEDILQEVFVIIYRKIYWLREPELFRPWAYRIASREAFKWLKREKRRNENFLDDVATEEIIAPVNESFEPELRACLPQLLTDISPASRAVIVLHYLHEMSLEEVAEVLGLAVGTVKSRLAYGLESLRKLMRQKGLMPVQEANNK